MKCVAIVGATGAVGQEFCAILRERDFPASSYRLLASSRSAGKQVEGVHGPATVEELTPDAFAGVDIALFSAGGSISREFAPHAVQAGAVVVDNSSAFRMEPDVPLVVPEINPEAVKGHQGIIANPNCSTIILAVVLWPLHQANPIRRVVVSTYQAASGAGARGLEELETQTRAIMAGETPRTEVFPVPCAFNVFSHNSPVGEDGFNVEERKLILEMRKIFDDPQIQVAPTCIRVPVRRAHSETATIEFTAAMHEDEARRILAGAPGVRIVDDRTANYFPTPLEATGRDRVLVGRIRQDPSVAEGKGLHLFCSGDQLRKGAALNAVQIAELLVEER
jgi:aspartate-semialdehyde dehydrogenase